MKILPLLLLSFLALMLAQPAQQQEPPSSDEQLAAQLMSEGKYEKAVVLYEELFENNQGPVIYNNYLKCLLELEEYRDAVKVVKMQMDENPGNVRFEVDLGYVYHRSDNSRRAKRQLEGLIKDLSSHPVSVTDLANAFLFRDFTDYALQTYLKGRKMLGESHSFHLQLASIYEKKGDYARMMEEYVELAIMDESYLEQVQGLLQDAVKDDPDLAKGDALRKVLLQGAQRNPSQILYAELLIWYSIQQKDFELALRQARVLDRRLEQEGKLVLDIAQLSASNNYFNAARQGFEYVVGFGDMNPYYLDATVGLLNVKYSQATAGHEIDYDLLREVEAEYETTIEKLGIRSQTVSLIRNLANLKAFYLNDTEEASQLLQNIIEMPNFSNRTKGECRIELADILLLQGELWDAHLLYAQVDKSFRDDPLAHEARFKNARLSFYMGEFKWAKAQLDVLKSATSRLMANDAIALSLLIQDNLEEGDTSVPLQMYARAEMHSYKNNFDLALSVLDSLEQAFASHQIIDDVFMAQSDILIQTGRYQQADKVLASVVENYSTGLHAAEALFKRALLQEQVFEDKELAMELYSEIMTKYPGSLRNADARNRFRYLRGDLSIEENFFRYGL